MRKLLVALPLVAGASWTGTTLYAGNQSQTTYDELIAQLNELKPFAAEKESYSAGFLKSVAVTQIKDSNAADANVLFRLRHEIDHSPVAFDSTGTRIGSSIIVTTLVTDGLPVKVKEEVLSGFTDSIPFVLTTSMGIGGIKSNELVLNTFVKSVFHEEGQRLDISFDGGNYEISHQQEQVTLGGSLGAVNISAVDVNGMPAMDMSVARSTTTANLQRISEGIYTGSFLHDLPAIEAQVHETSVDVNMRDINVATSTSLNDGKLTTGASFAVGELDTALPLTSAGLSFEVTGVPLDGLEVYLKLMDDIPLMQQYFMSDPEAIRLFTQAGKAILAPGSAIEYRVDAGNDGGDMMAAVNMAFVGDGSATGYDSIVTIGDALRAVKASVAFEADAAAVDMMPLGMLTMMSLEAQQLIVADGTSYKAELSIDDLKAEVNGSPFPLGFMLGGMLDEPVEMLMSM